MISKQMNFIENQIKFRKSNQNSNQEIKVSLLKINFNIVAPYLCILLDFENI